LVIRLFLILLGVTENTFSFFFPFSPSRPLFSQVSECFRPLIESQLTPCDFFRLSIPQAPPVPPSSPPGKIFSLWFPRLTGLLPASDRRFLTMQARFVFFFPQLPLLTPRRTVSPRFLGQVDTSLTPTASLLPGIPSTPGFSLAPSCEVHVGFHFTISKLKI